MELWRVLPTMQRGRVVAPGGFIHLQTNDRTADYIS